MSIKNQSIENPFSRELFELNKQYLVCKKELYETKRKRLSFSNIKILFSYIKSGAFSRIFRRLKKAKINNLDNNYHLKEYTSFPNCKVVIYTCIWGNYDDILEPIFVNPNIEYRIITDRVLSANSIWKKQSLPQNIIFSKMSPIEINRFCKMNPHLLFPDFDYSIYIDGNIRVVTDLMPLIADMGDSHLGIHRYQTDCIYNMKSAIIAGKRAKRKSVESHIKKYKKEGFPKNFGAFECNVIVRKHNEIDCIKIMSDWWDEFLKTPSKRDQISLPYVLWKNGLSSDYIFSLGVDVRLNPRFQVMDSHRR